jgi:4-hydroxythreonine-4-phosphate dehydrogenase
MNTFIFTCGDINGIGPEIVIKTLNRIVNKSKSKFLFICPEIVFFNEIKKNTPTFKYDIITSKTYRLDTPVSIISFGKFKREVGIPTKVSGQVSHKALELALNILGKSNDKAVITAPISKKGLKLAGIKFPGHTELFADWYRVKNYAMMFLSKQINATLLTIHQPIKKVAGLIDEKLLESKFNLFLDTLRRDLNVKFPKIAILGLNPHSGEDGFIGNEEKNIIIPFLHKFTKRKYFSGPFSSDAFFGMKMYLNYDMVVGMYHDQILNPFKLLNFNRGVNFTAGLPIVRTSPDHGTAYDIAGKGIANESSMIEAYKYASKILANRKTYGQN